MQRTVHKDVVFYSDASGFSGGRADIKMDADSAIKTSVVFDFVPDEVRHDASALRMVVDQVVQDSIVLAWIVVGEDPVRAIIMNQVISNNVFTGTKRRPAGINGQFDSGKARLVAVIFLDDIAAGAGKPDAIAFAFSRCVRIGVGQVSGNQGIIGFVQIDACAVIMHLIPRDLDIRDR